MSPPRRAASGALTMLVALAGACFDPTVGAVALACIDDDDCLTDQRCRGGRCESASVVPECGDGIVDDGEDCDSTDTNACNPNCTTVRCGDGIINGSEVCDTGDDNNLAGLCLPTCQRASCGDGFRLLEGDTPEACDDGDNNGSGGPCNSDCTINVCGDGVVRDGVEVCDDGNTDSGDGCRGDCFKLERCGDGVVDDGEVCDDDDDNPWDDCIACTEPIVGATLDIGAERVTLLANEPFDGIAIARDSDGALFISDSRGVFRVDGQRLVAVAGTGSLAPRTGLLGIESALRQIRALGFDAFGRLWMVGFDGICRLEADGSLTVIDTDAEGFLGFGNFVDGDGFVALDNGDVLVSLGIRNTIVRILPSGDIEVFAGQQFSEDFLGADAGFAGDGGPATEALFSQPTGLAQLPDGSIVVADTQNCRVRLIDPDGVISTIAGQGGTGNCGSEGDGGDALLASIRPFSVTPSPDGAIWVVESAVSPTRIREIRAGLIDTVVLPVPEGVSTFSPVFDVDDDGDDRLTLATFGSLSARSVAELRDGALVTLVGGVSSEDDVASARSVSAGRPPCLVRDGEGFFLIDSEIRRVEGGLIRKVPVALEQPFVNTCGDAERAPNGELIIVEKGARRVIAVDPIALTSRVVAGRGEAVFDGDGGLATEAGLAGPQGVAVDRAGNIYIADLFASRLRRVDAVTGVIDTVAGSGTVGSSGGSFAGEGVPALEARFNRISDVEVNDDGDLFIADAGNRRVRKIDAVTGVITTIAGTGQNGQSGDGGPALLATFSDPVDLGLRSDGSLAVADSVGALRLIEPDGRITRLLGNGESGLSTDGDGGPGDEARFGDLGCCFNGSGDIAFLDDAVLVAQVGFVRHIDLESRAVVTVVGAVDPPGLGAAPQTRLPGATGVDVAGAVTFVAGDTSGRVFRRRGDGSVDVVFGSPVGRLPPVAAKHHLLSGSVLDIAIDDDRGVLYVGGDDGVLRAVSFAASGPDGEADTWPVYVVGDDFGVIAGIAVDDDGAVLVVDRDAHCVRKSGPEATLPFVPVLGRCGVAGATAETGPALGTLLRAPTGVAVFGDAFFVADTGNNRVHRVDDGFSTAILGDGSESNAGEGSPSRAFPVRAPKAVAVDGHGNLWIAADNLVRLLPDGATLMGLGEVRSVRVAPGDDQLRCLRGVATFGADVVVSDTCAGVSATLSATPPAGG